MARVRTLRAKLEEKGAVVLLHAGDFLAPSLLTRTYGGQQMVDVLGALDGDPAAFDPKMFVVFGNHEFDAGKEADGPKLDAMIGGSGFTWLGANIRFAAGASGPIVADDKLPDDVVFDCGGLSVGMFGLTTNSKGAAFIESFADPVETARARTDALRARKVDVVIGLTHQALADDRALLTTLGAAGPDLIVGGHEHDQKREEIGSRGIYKADADAHTAWRITLSRGPNGIIRDAELLPLDSGVAEDPATLALVNDKLTEHDRLFCDKNNSPPGCLAASIGTTKVPLIGAELEIRRFETNLGNLVADVALGSVVGADIAIVNSGSLRLNRDLAAGPVRRQDIEELFAYPTPMARVTVDGATLAAIVRRSTEAWEGNGHWLQIAGFAYRFDPEKNEVGSLTRLPAGTPVLPTDTLTLALPAYLADPSTGQDGYTMITGWDGKTGSDLKRSTLDRFADGEVAPAVEGRICNAQRPGPCLAK